MSDDEPRTFTVTATKTLTATFEVDADDEDDATFQVENPMDMTSYSVDVSDALNVVQDEWDVSTVEVKS